MTKPIADIIVNHVVDERGRFISPNEFHQIMNSFQDRYSPVRLALALTVCCGLRSYDAVRVRLAWFDKEFTTLQMSQCKPSKIKSKDGKIHLRTQPRFVPLPEWLRNDLLNYVKYRLMVGMYIGSDLSDFRLFPRLRRDSLCQHFHKLRIRHLDKYPFLNELWRVVRGYNKEGELIWEKKCFRVAPHSGRAFYATAAYDISDKDIKATQMLTGHRKMDNLSKYIRVFGLQEKKQEIKEKYMDILTQNQTIPLLVGQTRLDKFGVENPVKKKVRII